MILFLVLLVLGAMYGLLASVDAATAQLEQRQRDETQQVLRQAKAALIAWSAARPDSPGPAVPGPGHLPCPDRDNNGEADPPITSSCGTAATRTGRLPWQTLGLPDLRDPSGERLWYAVSRCFLERTSDVFCSYAVNSDTQGQLTVTGLTPASNVVAVIFAPGLALAGQNRTAGPNVAANYLEGENGDASNDVFETRVRCLATDADCPGGVPFNDQMILITHADLFDVVETVVAKRLESEIKPALQAHFTAWQAVTNLYRADWTTPFTPGFYPFAAPFDDSSLAPTTPPTPTNPARDGANDVEPFATLCPSPAAPPPLLCLALYRGRAGQTHGLLPVTRDTTWMGWSGFSATKTGGSANFVAAPTCTAGASELRCDFSYQGAFGGMTVRVLGTVANVARSFALPIDETSIDSWADYGTRQVPTRKAIDPATGDLSIDFRLDLPAAPVAQPVTIRIPTPQFATWTQPTGGATEWFFKNRWHRHTYYAVSPAYAPGGGGSCNPPLEPCIQVQNTPAPDNDKRVVLTLAGRNLAPGVRTWTIANYFEGANASGTPLFDTPAPDYVFRRDLRSTAFNDRVVIVSP